MIRAYIPRRAWMVVFLVLVAIDTLVFSWFILLRPVMTKDQWQFLDKQRPVFTATGVTFNLCADCLEFAVARRPVGSWDPPANVVAVINLPAWTMARRLFDSRQEAAFGTSQGNADLATVVFVIGALCECALIAAVLSLRFR